MLTWLKKNWFVVGIVVALAGGLLVPQVGSALNPGGWTTTVIVLAQFLIIGMTLPSENIARGLMSYRLHIWVQMVIFVLTPLYFYFSSSLLTSYLDPGLIIGIIAGTFSSVFIAPSLLVVWDKGEWGRFIQWLPLLGTKAKSG